MTPKEVQEKVRSLVESYQGEGPVQVESTLDDLGMDSLDSVELMMELEDEFPGVDLSDYEPEGSVTLIAVAEEVHKRGGHRT